METNLVLIVTAVILIIGIILFSLIKKKNNNKGNVVKTTEKPNIVHPPLDIQQIDEIVETTVQQIIETTIESIDITPDVEIVRYIKTSGRDEFYNEKLKDENWKKKSAEIKRKQGYKCQECGSLGNPFVKLENIENLWSFVDFTEVYENVKLIFSKKDDYIELFRNNFNSKIDLSDFKRNTERLEENIFINSYEKNDTWGFTKKYDFFTQSEYEMNEIEQSESLIPCKLSYYAQNKEIKVANNILIEYIQQGDTTGKILLRHKFDYHYANKDAYIVFRGQGIITLDGFSIIFPLYSLDKPATLNVHHKAYYEDLEPWKCPENELITLCHRCHMKAHEQEIPVKRINN